MSDSAAREVASRARPTLTGFGSFAPGPLVGGFIAACAWLAAALFTALWPDRPESDWAYTDDLAAIFGALAVLIAAAVIIEARYPGRRRLQALSPWMVALALFFTVWELITAKYGLLPLPFFPPPQAIIEVVLEDRTRLAEGILASGRPLATGFPVTVLTWSGVAGVNSAYYDIARTLGASQRFLVLKVAIPAAMPHVFVGLFMGLGNSFAVLVVAEMLGVRAGLGWYLQWAQGWAAYANMYAALLIMALVCSGLITLLFRLRDRLLSWQRGLVRW